MVIWEIYVDWETVQFSYTMYDILCLQGGVYVGQELLEMVLCYNKYKIFIGKNNGEMCP